MDPHAIFMKIRKKRWNASKLGIVSLHVDIDLNALRTELRDSKSIKSFNYRIKNRDKKNELERI